MKTLRLACLPVLFLAFSGCIIDGGHHGCVGAECGTSTGDIQFYWNFALPDGTVTDDCVLADVARISVSIYNDNGGLEFTTEPDRPCGDTGATITAFYPGSYQIELEGYCDTGAMTYQGFFTVDVVGNATNDFGSLTLENQGQCI